MPRPRIFDKLFPSNKPKEVKSIALSERSPKTTLPTTLEDAKQVLEMTLEQNHPELYCDLTTFPGESTRKDLFDKGEVLSNPEYAAYAQEMIESILEQGIIICRSKLQPKSFQTLKEYGVVYFAGAIEPADLATATNLISWANKSPMNSFTKVGMGTGDLGSTITTHIDAQNPHVPFQMMHAFPTGHMERGGCIPAYMHYLLPQELGEKLEQDIIEDPWRMEALSELIVKNAREELQKQQLDEFSFPRLYDNSMAETEMHARSVAQKVLALFAFRNK